MILYTSVKKSGGNLRLLKTLFVYLAVSAFCIIFNKIYGLYGHGVKSAAMSLMFLYPLIGGAMAFMLLRLLVPDAANVPKYRLYYNIYNSGIAALIIGNMLKGIFDIAGTSSQYTVFYFILGWLLSAIGVIGFFVNSRKHK